MPVIAAPWTLPKSAARWRCRSATRSVPVARPFGKIWGRMRSDSTHAASAIFAANRAQGSVTFDVHQVEGVTRRRHLHESGSLRVRFPSPEAEGLSAVFVNTAGGIAGGDRFDIDIAAGEGSRLAVTTAAAEKIYRAQGPAAQVNIALKAAQARTSPGCRRRPSCSTAPGSRAGSISIWRKAPRCCCAKSWCSAAPRWASACCMANSSTAGGCGAAAGWCSPKPFGSTATSAKNSAQPAIAKGGVAIGTALIVPGDEALVERIRDAVGFVRRRGRHLRLEWVCNGALLCPRCGQASRRHDGGAGPRQRFGAAAAWLN